MGWHISPEVESTTSTALVLHATFIVDSFPEINNPEVPKIFQILKERSSLSQDELLATFNMGVGMAVITPQPQDIIDVIRGMGIPAWRIGEVSFPS